MADPKQVKRLMQGVEVWNEWRRKNPDVQVDLVSADFSDANLSDVDFRRAYLNGANFKLANLSRANFAHAYLSNADFSSADLTDVNFYRTNLSGASLGRADLSGANFHSANLSEVVLVHTMISGTSFQFTDLSEVIGLEYAHYNRPVSIGIETLRTLRGKIPTIFLRGCGLSDFEIESVKLYNPNLSNREIDEILYKVHDLRAHQSIQISPLFISYSHADSVFVDKVERYLDQEGVRFWRDVHHATAGPLETQIGAAIRQNPTVLLVLSANSIQSDWVEHEVRLARELAKEMKRHVLCPVALDSAWQSSFWPQRLMEQVKEYNILDFSVWQDDSKFQSTFVKLLDGLQLFYKSA